jgi:hypothetical protein
METFPNLDTHRLVKDMTLVERGRGRGEINQPSTSSTTLDFVEEDVLEHVGAAQKRANDDLENHLASFRQRLVDLDFESRFSDIKAAAMGSLSDLKEELQTGVDDLHGLRRDLTAAEKWHGRFREKNGLERPARIATTRSTTLKVILIVFLVLVELILNGELLS